MMAGAAQKEAAAQVMEHYADHDWHGYTQGDGRWGDGEGVCEVDTAIGTVEVEQGDRDCSSGVTSAYESVGISCGGATWTGNMLDCMTGTGNFRAHAMSDGWSCDDGYIAQRGDCYLAHHGGFQHTAMCISSEPDMLAEFSISETGGIYGRVGDQTGYESRKAPFYGGWDWCLECIVDDEGDEIMAISDADARKIALAILEYKNKGINGDNDFYELHSTMLRKQDAASKKLDAIAKDVAALKKVR